MLKFGSFVSIQSSSESARDLFELKNHRILSKLQPCCFFLQFFSLGFEDRQKHLTVLFFFSFFQPRTDLFFGHKPLYKLILQFIKEHDKVQGLQTEKMSFGAGRSERRVAVAIKTLPLSLQICHPNDSPLRQQLNVYSGMEYHLECTITALNGKRVRLPHAD